MKFAIKIPSSLSHILTLLVLASLLGGNTPLRQPLPSLTLVIDPGHGGRDPGTLGRISQEKKVVLDVSLKLGKILKEKMPDVKVIFTRTTDAFVELYKRAELANKNKADLFISIHANATPRYMANRHLVHGTETYVMGLHKSEENLDVAMRENASILKEANYEDRYQGFQPNSPQSYILFSLSQQTYLSNSLNLAHKIESEFKNRVKRKSRGVKQAGFVVLSKTAMPSVLVELGFLSNPTEEQYLNSAQGQTYLASAIYRAIRDYRQDLVVTE